MFRQQRAIIPAQRIRKPELDGTLRKGDQGRKRGEVVWILSQCW